MGKRKKYKKAVAGASAFVLGVSAFIPAAPVYAAEGISVNPQIHYQTLKGWETPAIQAGGGRTGNMTTKSVF